MDHPQRHIDLRQLVVERNRGRGTLPGFFRPMRVFGLFVTSPVSLALTSLGKRILGVLLESSIKKGNCRVDILGHFIPLQVTSALHVIFVGARNSRPAYRKDLFGLT